MAPYSKLGSIPINLPEPYIGIFIKGEIFMFTYIYYMYDKSLKDKLSKLTLYVVSSLHLTYQVSSNMTNI